MTHGKKISYLLLTKKKKIIIAIPGASTKIIFKCLSRIVTLNVIIINRMLLIIIFHVIISYLTVLYKNVELILLTRKKNCQLACDI